MISSQPYLLRAIHEWILDNKMTPYVLVDVQDEKVYVPTQYVDKGKIVLNISPQAVNGLELGNEFIMFNARFSGAAVDVHFPISSVLAIYAKENGKGMVFNEGDDGGDTPDPDKPAKPNLKIVK